MVHILYWRCREHCTCVWTGSYHWVPIWNTLGGVCVFFHNPSLPHTCLVLGWSMFGFDSGVVLLHGSEAVRYRLNPLARIVRTDNYRTTAGNTGSLTPIKPSRTRGCLLRIPSSPYNGESPGSEEDPATTANMCVQETKNSHLRLAVSVRCRKELRRTTSFEFQHSQHRMIACC